MYVIVLMQRYMYYRKKHVKVNVAVWGQMLLLSEACRLQMMSKAQMGRRQKQRLGSNIRKLPP